MDRTNAERQRRHRERVKQRLKELAANALTPERLREIEARVRAEVRAEFEAKEHTRRRAVTAEAEMSA